MNVAVRSGTDSGQLRCLPKKVVQVVARDAHPCRRNWCTGKRVIKQQPNLIDYGCCAKDASGVGRIAQQVPQDVERLGRYEFSTDLMPGKFAGLEQSHMCAESSSSNSSGCSCWSTANDCHVEFGSRYRHEDRTATSKSILPCDTESGG